MTPWGALLCVYRCTYTYWDQGHDGLGMDADRHPCYRYRTPLEGVRQRSTRGWHQKNREA